MKVLKFGGTSVGSAKNINNVISILENYSKTDSIICAVSAVGGITDKLLLAGKQAQNKDAEYNTTFSLIKDIHFNIINELNPSNEIGRASCRERASMSERAVKSEDESSV